jgi:DNA-binding response OmpR family regulator
MLALYQKNDLKEADMTKKILAIGNDPTLLDLLQQNLSDDSYEVATTQRTGYVLKDVLHREKPDFIIQDIMMPNLDGIGVCLQLRQWTQIPIMLLSTWGADDGMIRGLNLGSETYLTESFGVEELKTRIAETLKRSTATIDPLANTSLT